MGKPTPQASEKEKEITLATKKTPLCREHHTTREWRAATFEYHDGDIFVRVPNIFAWVCPQDGEATFTPETVDELIAIAQRAKHRRSALTEYIISVGEPVPV